MFAALLALSKLFPLRLLWCEYPELGSPSREAEVQDNRRLCSPLASEAVNDTITSLCWGQRVKEHSTPKRGYQAGAVLVAIAAPPGPCLRLGYQHAMTLCLGRKMAAGGIPRRKSEE